MHILVHEICTLCNILYMFSSSTYCFILVLYPFCPSQSQINLHYLLRRAQSGSGKTATFALSILQRVQPRKQQTQALVLSPTRELAQQIQRVVSALGDFLQVRATSPCFSVFRENILPRHFH